MDVSAFSDDHFDVKDWINKSFKCPEAQDNRDTFVSSLVMKLQLYVQQVNGALEETSQQVLQSLPRVVRDTEILQQEAVLLREKMQSVKQEIAKVEQDTGQSMANLEQLDRIKTELQVAKQALHEADNWTVLAADLEEVFESGNVETIATKLVSMQQSLRILANAPDYEDRKLQLEGLKNRLEAMSSPLLVQAFTTGSVDESKRFVKIFQDINRLQQLIKYYHKCHKATLIQKWRNLIEMDQEDGIADCMSKFYDSLMSYWHDQIKWCTQVFTTASPVDILIELYTDVLNSLDPSFNVCMDAALKQQSAQLPFLLSLKQTTKYFASSLQVAIESASQGKELPEDVLLQLAKAVYYPYVVYISKYASYEQQFLRQQLSGMKCIKEELMDTIQGLGQSIQKAISFVTEAKKRCIQFTEGCGYMEFVKAIEDFFINYVDHFHIALRTLHQQTGDKEDWNMFQMCLTLMQSVGELLNQLQQLDRGLVHTLLDTFKSLYIQGSSPFVRYNVLLLTANGRKELETCVSKFQGGEETSLLDTVFVAVEKLCKDVHYTTYQVIFTPISKQLDQVATAPAWNSKEAPVPLAVDLPDFSFTPQEYITQIGQYLMTLPQHLEPFMLQENSALTLALRVADPEYESLSGEAEGGFADILLGIIARGTCQEYCENILGICELSPSAVKQLATDINYLGNVLEDLGLGLSDHLQQVSQLLRLPADDYQRGSSGCQPRLVAAVRQMRNITSAS